uniref:Uncharacterized protein n=1 Tax=Saccharolobus islandicus TaxID=43080 RepID=Q5W2Z2_SACIS|nr:hypothetical protein [Sulfolobus islandicus]
MHTKHKIAIYYLLLENYFMKRTVIHYYIILAAPHSFITPSPPPWTRLPSSSFHQAPQFRKAAQV